MAGRQTHFSIDGKAATCGSSTDSNTFRTDPESVTCKRCQKTYEYMETVDALTRPAGAEPRYKRPAYAESKVRRDEYPEDVLSPEYQEWLVKETEKNNASALRNATRQATEVISENEPVYELSYTVTSHKVKQSQLVDFMQTLIAAKAINLKVVQIPS